MPGYVIFKIFNKKTYPKSPFYMSYVEDTELDLLSWYATELRKFKSWFSACGPYSEKFFKSYLLLIDTEQEIDFEFVEKYEKRDVPGRIRELCEGKRSFNNFGSKELDTIYEKRRQHLDKLLKQKFRWKKSLDSSKDIDIEKLEIDRKTCDTRIKELEHAIYIHENFKSMNITKPKLPIENKTSNESSKEVPKPYVPPARRNKVI